MGKREMRVIDVVTNKVVKVGTIKDIADFVLKTFPAVYSAIRNEALISNKYKIEYTGKIIPSQRKEKPKTVKEKKIEKKMTEHQQLLDYLILHLKTYGNTIMMVSPEPWRKELNDAGIKFKTRMSQNYHNSAVYNYDSQYIDDEHYLDIPFYVLERI